MEYSQEGIGVTRLKTVNFAHFHFHGNFPECFRRFSHFVVVVVSKHLGRRLHSLLWYTEQTECVSLWFTCVLHDLRQAFPPWVEARGQTFLFL